MKQKITFSLSAEIVEQLRKEAKDRSLPLSTLVQLVLETYCNEKRKENCDNE